MRSIFRLITAKRTICQGMHVRMYTVNQVGTVAEEISGARASDSRLSVGMVVTPESGSSRVGAWLCTETCGGAGS
jgi:hypothetical protein